MTEKQVGRYLELVAHKISIPHGIDWKPEYEKELAQIDQEIAELRVVIEEEMEKRGERKNEHTINCG